MDLLKIIEAGKNIEELWGGNDPVTYKGYDLITLSTVDVFNEAKESCEMFSHIVSSEEVYLGYRAKDDTFISGFDATFTEEDDDSDETYFGHYILEWQFDDGMITIVKESDFSGSRFYGSYGGYKNINKDEVLNIRLD